MEILSKLFRSIKNNKKKIKAMQIIKNKKMMNVKRKLNSVLKNKNGVVKRTFFVFLETIFNKKNKKYNRNNISTF
jgi:hypothetical protein